MNAVIFGSSGGIGSALVKGIIAGNTYQSVFAVSRSGDAITGATSLKADLADEEALAAIVQKIADAGPVTLCVIALGILSNEDGLTPERSYRSQSTDAFEQIFHANTIIPALIAKHMLTIMPRDKRAIFAALSARVGSISDNRLGGWHAYRASKAALNMLIKNYAIEQRRRSEHFIAVGLHPGTVDTSLSKPFQSNVPRERLFTPTQSADYLLNVIDRLTSEDSGKIFDWAGIEIPA